MDVRDSQQLIRRSVVVVPQVGPLEHLDIQTNSYLEYFCLHWEKHHIPPCQVKEAGVAFLVFALVCFRQSNISYSGRETVRHSVYLAFSW